MFVSHFLYVFYVFCFVFSCFWFFVFFFYNSLVGALSPAVRVRSGRQRCRWWWLWGNLWCQRCRGGGSWTCPWTWPGSESATMMTLLLNNWRRLAGTAVTAAIAATAATGAGGDADGDSRRRRPSIAKTSMSLGLGGVPWFVLLFLLSFSTFWGLKTECWVVVGLAATCSFVCFAGAFFIISVVLFSLVYFLFFYLSAGLFRVLCILNSARRRWWLLDFRSESLAFGLIYWVSRLAGLWL